MADKVQLIKEEIEKRKQEIWPKNTGEMRVVDTPKPLVQGWLNALDWVLNIINSIPEEPTSEDLDFLVISLEETIGTSPHSREAIKEHLQIAAEWQKKKDQATIEQH